MKLHFIAATLALSALVGCDDGEADARSERESKLYQSAVNDYNAGRLKQATETFRKVCREEPANAMARFQLACLLQDHAKDYSGAFHCYSEFLNQRPDSDRSRIARERLEVCEKEVARSLAEKYGLSDSASYVRETESARAAAAAAEKTSAKLRDDLMQAMQRIAALGKENDRLKDALRDDGSAAVAATPAVSAAEVRSAKSLLDGDDVDRITSSADIAQLRLEEAAETALNSSPLLPEQAPDARQRRDAAENAAREKVAREQAAASAGKPTRPATYVVAEGDTLYKIAVRFYGRTSAWRAIRNANKSKISIDGRVKVGAEIRLP